MRNNADFYYTITTPRGILEARPLSEMDIDAAAGILVCVTKSNYKEILGIGCEGSYAKSGALLETDRSTIEQFVCMDQFQTCGIWSQDGEMLAWIAGQTGGAQARFFKCKENFFFEPGCGDVWQGWQEAIQKGTIVADSYMMVKHPAQYPHLGLILLAAWSRVLLEMGIMIGVSELDCICACIDADGTHELNIDNKASLFNFMFMGHRVVAKTVCDRIKVDEDITVKCVSSVFEGSIPETNRRIQTVMERMNIHIEAICNESQKSELCSVTF